MDSPLVSIIMPVYNGERYMSESIQSVLDQQYGNWELIIVDDGSSDNSLGIASSYRDDRIKVFQKQNSGASATRNYGFLHSSGPLVKFFDADDLMNEMLAAQVALANQNPDCIISGKWARFYQNDIHNLRITPEECWKDMDPVDWISTSWKNAKSMTQPGIFLIPRNVIERGGLWDERLSLVDDLEFFTKTILASKKVVFSSGSMLYYRSGNEDSLASQTGRKASESCFRAMELSTGYLLRESQSQEARQSAANIWQSFIFHFYPNEKDLVKRAEQHLKALPKPTLKFPTTTKTNLLVKIFGWKSLKNLKRLLRA